MIGQRGGSILAGAAALAGLMVRPPAATAADHRDGPRVIQNGLTPLDINDVYVFVSPANRNNTVIAPTTGGPGWG